MFKKESDSQVQDTVLKVYVRSRENPLTKKDSESVESIKTSENPTRPEKFAAIGLSFVAQSIVKYAGESGIYLPPDEHSVLRIVKQQSLKGNIAEYEFIELTKGIQFDVEFDPGHKLVIIGPYEQDKSEREIRTPCLRIGNHTTWPREPGCRDITKYDGIEGARKRLQEKIDFVLSFYRKHTPK